MGISIFFEALVVVAGVREISAGGNAGGTVFVGFC